MRRRYDSLWAKSKTRVESLLTMNRVLATIFILVIALWAFATMQYTLTVINSIPVGTVTPGDGAHLYDSNTFVNVHYVAPLNYVFKRWTISGAGIQPNSDTSVLWIHTSGGTLTAVDSMNVVCWKNIIHVVAGTGGTIITPTHGYDTVCVHNTSAIVAVPSMGYRFDSWTGAGVTFTQCCSNVSQATMDDTANHTATANFTKVQYTLTMANAPHAGLIFPALGTHLEDSGTLIAPLTFIPPSGYKFTRWYRSNTSAVIADSNNILTNMYLKADATVTAGDTLKQFTASIAAGAGGHVSPGSYSADSAASFSIYARTIIQWYAWSGWTQGGGGAVFTDETAETTTVYLIADAAIIGNWSVIPATAPTLVYPANGDTGVSKSVFYRWNKVAADSFYILNTDTVITFNSGAKTLDTTTDTIMMRAYTDTKKQVRYWRVYGQNIGGKSAASLIWAFTETKGNKGGFFRGISALGLKQGAWFLMRRK